MNRTLLINPSPRRQGRSLVLAALIGLCGVAGSAAVNAQSTEGVVFGNAPVGHSVSAVSATTGVQREVHVDSGGRYSIRSLPVGVYTVTLEENGHGVVKHPNVPVIVGRGIKVDFDCAQGKCGEAVSKQ